MHTSEVQTFFQKKTKFCQVAFAQKEKTCQSHLATLEINKPRIVNLVVRCVSMEQWEFTKLLAR